MQPQCIRGRAAVVGVEQRAHQHAERVHVCARLDIARVSEPAESHRAAGVDEDVLSDHRAVDEPTQMEIGEVCRECGGDGHQSVRIDGCRHRPAGERQCQLDALAVVEHVHEIDCARAGRRRQPSRDVPEPIGILRRGLPHDHQAAVGAQPNGMTGHLDIIGRNGMKYNKVHDMQWEGLLDEARADELAAARVRERWLRQQATESATLLGTLLDLAESGAGINISVRGGRRHDGRLVGLGHDLAVVIERGSHVVLRLAAVTVVRPSPGSGAAAASGTRTATLDLHFGELLARVVDDQPDVAVSLESGEVLTGALLAAGEDVLTLRLAAGADGLAYCSTAAVSSVRLRSG